MTLAQTAMEKIALLSEANLRIVLAVVNEMLRQNDKTIIAEKADETERSLSAFHSVMEKRKKSPFPADFDYEKIL